jgi:hypothetical protein
MDAIDRMIGDLLEDTPKIELRIESVNFGRPEQRIDGSCTFFASVGR